MLGLVVEGGANRTYYSIGVMDAFLDNNIEVDFLVGVSAGIANAVSYISKQKGRGLTLGTDYIPDKRYMGFKYFLKKGNKSYYNRKFVFNDIPNKHLPFDYDTFASFKGDVYAVVTNIERAIPEYHKVSPEDKDWLTVQASCALPIMFSPIEINGKKYFDGGCTDPLPVKFAFDKGCDKVITILTRERDYTKESQSDEKISSFLYRRHKAFSDSLKVRSKVYNDSKEYLYNKEKEGSAFIFTPQSTANWKRTEKNPDKLKEMYFEGYNDCVRQLEELKRFING